MVISVVGAVDDIPPMGVLGRVTICLRLLAENESSTLLPITSTDRTGVSVHLEKADKNSHQYANRYEASIKIYVCTYTYYMNTYIYEHTYYNVHTYY